MTFDTSAVLSVGAGRGFVVETNQGDRLVITAAHCLPRPPSGFTIGFTEERTYGELLGPLGEAPSVWAECLFFDPIADLAVLGTPDTQELFQEAGAWDDLVAEAGALSVGPSPNQSEAWLLDLEGKWYETRVNRGRGPILIFTSGARLQGGMSGSPIIVNGQAAGVVVTDQFANPYILQALPVWLVEQVVPSG